jgi:hypothetical protein
VRNGHSKAEKNDFSQRQFLGNSTGFGGNGFKDSLMKILSYFLQVKRPRQHICAQQEN